MQEAQNVGLVVLALVVIIGLFTSIGNPILKAVGTMTRLDLTMKQLIDAIAKNEADNDKEHTEIRQEIAKVNNRVDNCNSRIDKIMEGDIYENGR